MIKREPWNPLLKSYPKSRKINAVSLGAEVMFVRLLALCDDHSNYDGDPKLLLSGLFGDRWANGTVSLRNCARWRNELVTIGLVELYRPGDGREYLHVVNCKKMLRSDIKEDIRFPDKAQVVDPQTLTESVTNPGRKRNASGSSCLVPPSTSTSTSVAVDSHTKETADERRERQATELVALYWTTISNDGSKSQAVTNCTKLLKTIGYDDLKLAVERRGDDHAKYPSDFEFRASNFFGRKAYYKDCIGDAYEPRQAPAGSKPKANSKDHYKNGF